MELGTFGPRVIGEQLAAEEAAIVTTQSHIYGPRVLGDGDPSTPVAAAPAAAAPQAVAQATPPREMTTDELRAELERRDAVAAAEAERAKRETETSSLSIDGLADALKKNPASLDDYLRAEFQRVEGPRMGALRAMRGSESQRAGGARSDVIAMIDAGIEAKTALAQQGA